MIWIAAAACCPDGPSIDGTGTRELALDQAFHQDPRWLGGDGAYTIDLNDGRVLWLFGDSFIATSDAHVRTEATMVRNSVAVMDGTDLHVRRSVRPGARGHAVWPHVAEIVLGFLLC